MNIQKRLQIEFEFLGEEQISANTALNIINDVFKEAESEQFVITDVMQEFNSLIVRLVELLSVKYPNRQVNNVFVDNLKTLWKGNEKGLKANIEALEKELNFV